ncbi:amidohydrolase family protein [Bosea sp. SSUT16]|jgi:N-acetylglucosamine-6-phosphate deacetylase|uniref:Amidohydrolase family protein n=1 Tax=Bosea spartocytisi TaxID=2773451 RepID=A0A927EA54_9HYPH|nr:amidohydrolase family protein [Bosea spartocytisi]MBD3846185.1 amidohydrolase family protein [Bosea spartocytisi]MCT4473369.1 amidohydrolase family protein [Bosea spartocytisi]
MRTPGLVDLQVNGFAGVDFNSGTITAAELDRALEAMLATGVTTCLPTIITAHPHELAARFTALDKAVSESRLGPLMCPGYHLEGPFLNPTGGYAGCHPPEAMTAADAGLIAKLEQGLARPILMVTLAPEVAGGIALVAALARLGKVVAIGHAAVDFEIVAAAADAGATLSTHLGNGLPQQMHKLVNPLFAQLAEDRLMAGFIADGIHIHPKALKSLIRAKGLERSILVTDAVVAAGAEPGRYSFAGMPVDLAADGSVRQPGGVSLAGSALKLDDAVRNVVAWAIATPEGAVAMASTHALAAIAGALAKAGIALPESEIAWSPELRVRSVRVGDITREFAAPAAA